FTGANSIKQLFNGMEIYNGGNVVSFPFDPWNVDHIGVLYGPSSVLYGSGAVGCTVNVVAGRPDPTLRRHEVQLAPGRSATYNVADAALNFTDNWTNVETVWTPSARLSVHNNTYAMYHDRVYRDVPNYAYVAATNTVRRTQFRDINDTYETQYGDNGYVK